MADDSWRRCRIASGFGTASRFRVTNPNLLRDLYSLGGFAHTTLPNRCTHVTQLFLAPAAASANVTTTGARVMRRTSNHAPPPPIKATGSHGVSAMAKS